MPKKKCTIPVKTESQKPEKFSCSKCGSVAPKKKELCKPVKTQ